MIHAIILLKYDNMHNNDVNYTLNSSKSNKLNGKMHLIDSLTTSTTMPTHNQKQ